MADTPLLPYGWDPLWDENESFLLDELNTIVHVTDEVYIAPVNSFQNTSLITEYGLTGDGGVVRGPSEDSAGRKIHWD